MESLIKLCLLSMLAAVAAWNCPDQCHCSWRAGKRSANCSYAGLSDIPTLTPETQILNLTGNNLTEIRGHAFVKDQFLGNLQKLLLRDCKLTTIHEDGLSDLAILVELDLAKNYLTTLHTDTFQELHKVRWISLNDNLLEMLQDNLFYNLPHLQKVDLSNNKIVQIGVNTFMDVPKLNYLKLDNNRLEYLKVDTLNATNSLTSLELNDNRWRCDCKLQPLVNWVISKNLYAKHVACAEPANLRGKLWKDLEANDFACQPDILPIVHPKQSASVPI